METKQNKPHWKLNIFDVILITVVIVAAGALIFIWRSSGKSSNTPIDTKQVHYTVELTYLLPEAADKIKAGDTIFDGTKKFIMGKVVSVTIQPTKISTEVLATGELMMSEVPGRETALIELVCDCSATDSEITAESGYVVRIGANVNATGPGYAGKGNIVVINREDLGQ